jgi:hypothetical protein
MFSNSAHGPESCGAAAIEACVELLKPTGGKIHAFLATLPNSGESGSRIISQSTQAAGLCIVGGSACDLLSKSPPTRHASVAHALHSTHHTPSHVHRTSIASVPPRRPLPQDPRPLRAGQREGQAGAPRAAGQHLLHGGGVRGGLPGGRVFVGVCGGRVFRVCDVWRVGG